MGAGCIHKQAAVVRVITTVSSVVSLKANSGPISFPTAIHLIRREEKKDLFPKFKIHIHLKNKKQRTE